MSSMHASATVWFAISVDVLIVVPLVWAIGRRQEAGEPYIDMDGNEWVIYSRLGTRDTGGGEGGGYAGDCGGHGGDGGGCGH